MRSVGAFEAKTHLAALLDAVSAGEQITITRHGRPVARLVPPVAELVPRRAVRDQLPSLQALRDEAAGPPACGRPMPCTSRLPPVGPPSSWGSTPS